MQKLRDIFIVLLIYGTWELVGNKSLRLNNGISFIVGVAVAVLVLMLLVAFQLFIHYAIQSSSTVRDKPPVNEDFAHHIQIYIDTLYVLYQKAIGVGVTRSCTKLENEQDAKEDMKQLAQNSREVDELIACLVVCKLILSWNSESEWQYITPHSSVIRLVLLLLYILHLNGVFSAVATICVCMPLSFNCQSVHHFITAVLIITSSLVIASFLTSDVIYLLIDDTSSSFSIHRHILEQSTKDSALTGVLGSVCVFPAAIILVQARIRDSESLMLLSVFFVLISVALTTLIIAPKFQMYHIVQCLMVAIHVGIKVYDVKNEALVDHKKQSFQILSFIPMPMSVWPYHKDVNEFNKKV